MKLYGCDYINPSSDELEYFVFDAEDDNDAHKRAIEELKTHDIPKRYIVNVMEVL